MNKELSEKIRAVCIELYGEDTDPELTRPDMRFGDFASNVALRLAKHTGKKPREIAEEIAAKLKKEGISAELAGPGFINIRISDADLFKSAVATKPDEPLAQKTILVEYSDPNPFKILHAGHLYTTLVGDSIANVLQKTGANVHRLNYGGDVGLHVAKSMWAILKGLGGENPGKLTDIPGSEKLKWLSQKYIEGNKAYESDEHAKNSIDELNKRIYALHQKEDKDSPLAEIYWTCRGWSYDGFEDLYKKLRVADFEKYYPESSVAGLGLKTVRSHTGKVYEESDGAVVFRGEEDGLHTRVFITKEGLPTYEAKDVGLLLQKREDYEFDRSVVITANEQAQYMQVVLASVGRFEPKLSDSTVHLTHGMVKLSGSVKMSSRQGNFLSADDVLDAASQASIKARGQDDPDITLGAIKYAFLKNRIGGDIIYDPKESVSIEGNSGPYLQYALVRAKSILAKAGKEKPAASAKDLKGLERTLARQLSQFSETLVTASTDLSPHHVCSYLHETCQIFNSFYENNRVIGDERSGVRLALVKSYASILQQGLAVLGIPTPEKM